MNDIPFQKVAVLMGGPSAEREVSLRSGAAVAKGLRDWGYRVEEVVLADREVPIPDGAEAVFIALHGVFGEDGELQQILRERGVPYTGSGPEASRLCFDKIATKTVLTRAGIPVPSFEVVKRGELPGLPLPVVVKPARQGSSIGVHIVFDRAELEPALEEAWTYDEEVIVEVYIPGHELTVGIIEEMALPVIEIRAPGGFYDYRAKYTKGVTEYLVPAPLPEKQAHECQEIAVAVFRALGCRDLGRVDFRMDDHGRLYVLELNSIPGFTETSLLPKAASAAGITFPELCHRVMRRASVH